MTALLSVLLAPLCLNCGNPESFHHSLSVEDCPGFRDEPLDSELANGSGVEGGIAYSLLADLDAV